VPQQRARACEQRGVRGRREALQGLERLRDDAPVGIGEQRLQPLARARGSEGFRRDAAPPPIRIARQCGGGRDAAEAVRLRQRDHGLSSDRERTIG
jgi:hypothetical protein